MSMSLRRHIYVERISTGCAWYSRNQHKMLMLLTAWKEMTWNMSTSYISLVQVATDFGRGKPLPILSEVSVLARHFWGEWSRWSSLLRRNSACMFARSVDTWVCSQSSGACLACTTDNTVLEKCWVSSWISIHKVSRSEKAWATRA